MDSLNVDSLQKIDKGMTAKVSIIQERVDQGTKAMECVYFAKDMEDLFLIVMTKPETEKGNGNSTRGAFTPAC